MFVSNVKDVFRNKGSEVVQGKRDEVGNAIRVSHWVPSFFRAPSKVDTFTLDLFRSRPSGPLLSYSMRISVVSILTWCWPRCS